MQHFISTVELCAGAGGQAMGLERGGFLTNAWSKSIDIVAPPFGSTSLPGRSSRWMPGNSPNIMQAHSGASIFFQVESHARRFQPPARDSAKGTKEIFSLS